jgi:hypothetical protein
MIHQCSPGCWSSGYRRTFLGMLLAQEEWMYPDLPKTASRFSCCLSLFDRDLQFHLLLTSGSNPQLSFLLCGAQRNYIGSAPIQVQF